VSGRRLALVALLGLAIPVVTTRPASAVTAGDWCGKERVNQGALDTDPNFPARPLVCQDSATGFRWQPGTPGAPSIAATPMKGPLGQAAPSPAAGQYCATGSASTLAAETARVLICQSNRWVEQPLGPALNNRDPLDAVVAGIPDANIDGIPASIAPDLTTDVLGTAAVHDPLPYDLGDPTGLPPGVVLPPGTTVLGGFPKMSPSDDWWKAHSWITEAFVATSNLEAVNAHFVQQCANIGWLYDPRREARLPTPTPPAPGYDKSVQMVLGECRTVLGSPTDPTRVRPWYMVWSVARRFGSPSVELVVQLTDTPREGGRPG